MLCLCFGNKDQDVLESVEKAYFSDVTELLPLTRVRTEKELMHANASIYYNHAKCQGWSLALYAILQVVICN